MRCGVSFGAMLMLQHTAESQRAVVVAGSDMYLLEAGGVLTESEDAFERKQGLTEDLSERLSDLAMLICSKRFAFRGRLQ